LDLELDNIVPHNALGDVRVLEKIFERLFQKMMVDFKDEHAVIAEMLEISSKMSGKMNPKNLNRKNIK
jgi:hypothetical protein